MTEFEKGFNDGIHKGAIDTWTVMRCSCEHFNRVKVESYEEFCMMLTTEEQTATGKTGLASMCFCKREDCPLFRG